MKTKMDYLSQRQGLLAQNIANADTPDYKAQDLAPLDFQQLLKNNGASSGNLPLTVTHSNDIVPADASGDFKVIDRATTSELNPDGNNVAIEDETAKMAMNQLEYQKVLNLYGKAVSMFKTAIGNANTGS